MRHVLTLSILLFSSLIGGCTTNAIRIDRAATMSQAGGAAVKATLDMADQAMRANEAAIIEIAVYDPNCDLPQPRIAVGARNGLCRTDVGGTSIPFFRTTKRDLLPTLAVVGGITAYLDAIDEIVTREPADIEGSLAGIGTDLEAVRTIIGQGAIPQLETAQVDAINSALNLVNQLAAEAASVDSLRELERQRGPELFDESIKTLDTLNERWVAIFQQSMKSQFSLVNQAYRAAPPADPGQRRALVARQMEINGLAENAPALKKSLMTLTATFKQAHTDYLDLLPAGSNASLTSAEKKKQALLIKSRVRAALYNVAALVASF